MCVRPLRRLRRWVGLGLLAGSATGAAAAADPAPGTLVVGFDRDFPPYEYLDDNGKPAGFDIELMRAAAAAAGFAVEFKPGHGPELVAALEAGRAQALAGVFRFARLERTFAFSASPSEVEFAIFTRAGTAASPRSRSPEITTACTASGSHSSSLTVAR